MEPEHENKTNSALGYVVVKEFKDFGYIGGYLCVNDRGIPIEFWHTTQSPVKTTSTQKLLYGKKLKPELFGRHITNSLVQPNQENRKTTPSLLFTIDPAIFEGFESANIAIVLIQENESQPPTVSNCSRQQISINSDQDVTVIWKSENDIQVNPLIPLVENMDLLEPFDRIDTLLEELKKRPAE